jgi:hypothetical protein
MPAGGVAEDVVEVFRQFLDDLLHALLRQRVLVPGLGGREDGQALHPLVANERLVEPRLARDDIDDVEDDAPLDAHIRSRFRKPTSKSMTTVFLPAWASPVAKAAEDVVLPTPPFPDVTTITCAMRKPPAFAGAPRPMTAP